MTPERVTCPECEGRGFVWAQHEGIKISATVEAECPYCGGSGTALLGALIREGYEVGP